MTDRRPDPFTERTILSLPPGLWRRRLTLRGAVDTCRTTLTVQKAEDRGPILLIVGQERHRAILARFDAVGARLRRGVLVVVECAGSVASTLTASAIAALVADSDDLVVLGPEESAEAAVAACLARMRALRIADACTADRLLR